MWRCVLVCLFIASLRRAYYLCANSDSIVLRQLSLDNLCSRPKQAEVVKADETDVEARMYVSRCEDNPLSDCEKLRFG